MASARVANQAAKFQQQKLSTTKLEEYSSKRHEFGSPEAIAKKTDETRVEALYSIVQPFQNGQHPNRKS